MNRHRGPIGLLVLISFALLVLLWPLEGSIEKQLTKSYPHRVNASSATISGGQFGGLLQFLQLAGLNSLLADVLWMKADDLWHSSSWWEMPPMLEAIVQMDPQFTLVWRILAWHYGWNLHAASKSAEDRAFWLDKAGDTYERATAINDKDYDLWWDMCWFYVDRTRQYDKAEDKLKQSLVKFPKEIDTIQRAQQRVYEKTWRVDDAVRVIKDILKKRPNDTLAKRDLEWWTKIGWGTQEGADENWRWILEIREHNLRATRDLPWYRNPFEGTLVSTPPWRDWNAPMYMNPDWKPNITRYPLQSLLGLFDARPDLREQWHKAHPEITIPRPLTPEESRELMDRRRSGMERRSMNQQRMRMQQMRQMMMQRGRGPGGPGR